MGQRLFEMSNTYQLQNERLAPIRRLWNAVQSFGYVLLAENFQWASSFVIFKPEQSC